MKISHFLEFDCAICGDTCDGSRQFCTECEASSDMPAESSPVSADDLEALEWLYD